MELEYTIKVLGIREDGMWCAITFDMSLRGYGETPKEALDQLLQAVEAQISFAVQHDNLDQIFTPAAPYYFELFDAVKRESVKRKLVGKPLGLKDMFSTEMSMPDPHPELFAVA